MTKELSALTAGRRGDYWIGRITEQIEFAEKLIQRDSTLEKAALDQALQLVTEELKSLESGRITGLAPKTVKRAEAYLEAYREEAKTFRVHCIGHAHMDMNWMWGHNETVSIVLATFRTMLDLMKEYPDFTFSQSQAQTYAFAADYAPELLDEIRMRVKEGRWEVTASTWTEFDKNMPNGESSVRQYLYAERYLRTLLNLPEGENDPFCIDFEPDTFGHHARVPDVLNAAGIQYYYHCRGYNEEILYRWRGQSKEEVIVYQEPNWYLGPVFSTHDDPSRGSMKVLALDMCGEVMNLYDRYGFREILEVYGVGDHGGGVTRMDIEALQDRAGWPCYPAIVFSTMKTYFSKLEEYIRGPGKNRIPILEGERNYIFTGCYTSQSEIKRANHEGEKMLYDAEALSVLRGIAEDYIAGVQPADEPVSEEANELRAGEGRNSFYNRQGFAGAWKKLLHNQFHDILPGSCTRSSKEYAMGTYQEVFALADTERAKAAKMLAYAINTQGIMGSKEGKKHSEGLKGHESAGKLQGGRAFGAGVGYGAERFKTSPLSLAEGADRVVTLFNALAAARKELFEVTLWDWEDKDHEVICTDSAGEKIPIEILCDDEVYWQHSAKKLLIPVEIPPLGYASYRFQAGTLPAVQQKEEINPRVEPVLEFILENENLRAQFSESSLELISLVNKKTGEELITAPSGLRYIIEDAGRGMTSWQAGRITSDEAFSPSAQEVQIQQNSLRSTLSAKLKRGNSVIRQQVSLDKEASSLRWELEADWLELGDHETIPQLAFSLNHIQPESGIADSGKDDSAAAEIRGEVIRYDIPFGIVRRSPKHMDVPALSWAARELGDTALQLTARGKHAFRCEDTMTRLVLLRSSSDPDPYPEFGEHSMQFTLSLFKGAVSDKDLINNGLLVNSDLVQVTHGRHAGYLPAEKSFVSVDGPVVLSSLKKEEDGDGIIMRLYEAEGAGGKVSVCLFDDAAEPLSEKAPERGGFNCREAVCTDVLEKRINKTIPVERSGNIFSFLAEPRGIYTLIFSCS